MKNTRHKIAVISDVHGNLPALQAALKSITSKNCDAIYHLGDAVAIGPYPGECLKILLAHPNLKLVMGNHDQWFAYGLPTPVPDWMSKGEIIHHRWLEKTFYSQLDKGGEYEV